MESKRNVFIFWIMTICTVLFFSIALYIGYQYYLNPPELPFLVVYKKFMISWTLFGIAVSVAGAVCIVLEIIPPNIFRGIVAGFSAYEALLIIYAWAEICNYVWTLRLTIIAALYLLWVMCRHMYWEHKRYARASD